MTSKLPSFTLPSFHSYLCVPERVLAPRDSQRPQPRYKAN